MNELSGGHFRCVVTFVQLHDERRAATITHIGYCSCLLIVVAMHDVRGHVCISKYAGGR